MDRKICATTFQPQLASLYGKPVIYGQKVYRLDHQRRVVHLKILQTQQEK